MKSVPFRIASGVLAALLLTACGSGTENDSTDNAAPDQESAASVATKFGDVEVPADPKRVVALGWGDAETALALGVQPVGASDWLAFGGEGVGPWAQGLYEEAPEIIGTMEPDFEAIAALEPDLILDVKSSGDQDRYDRLTDIAPTVGVPEGGDNYLTTTDAQVEMIATALGQEDKGTELLADMEAAFAAAAEAHPEFEGKSVAVAAYTSEGWGAYIEGTERVTFLENLGFELSEKIAEVEVPEFTVPISAEELDMLEADLLVTFPIFVEASEITKQAAYNKLAVVAEGRSVLIDDADISAAYSLGSVLSVNFAIESVVPLVAAAVAGNG